MKTLYVLQIISLAALLSACITTPKESGKATAPTNNEQSETVAAEQTTAPLQQLAPTLGQPSALVCSTPILAQGALKNRPNMQTMWENFIYDKPEGVWREIGGMVEVNGNLPYEQGQWTNACTVRLSYMLNKANHKIPNNGGKTVSGKDYDQYYYRVTDMEDYLKETFGAPDLAIEDGTANSFDLPNEAGIVLMDFPDNSFTGHITIWNGAGTVDGANIGGYRVLFWKLPCFTPKKKQSANRESYITKASLP